MRKAVYTRMGPEIFTTSLSVSKSGHPTWWQDSIALLKINFRFAYKLTVCSPPYALLSTSCFCPLYTIPPPFDAVYMYASFHQSTWNSRNDKWGKTYCVCLSETGLILLIWLPPVASIFPQGAWCHYDSFSRWVFPGARGGEAFFFTLVTT